MFKSKENNPDGLYQKYFIQKTNGKPVDSNAEYFVLRLDKDGEKNHVNACLKALKVYASEIEQYIPKLSADLKNKYNL